MSINNNCLIGNSMDVDCHNNYVVDDDEGIHNDYCNAETSSKQQNTCSSLAKQLLAYTVRDHTTTRLSFHELVEQTTTTSQSSIRMDTYDKHSRETLIRIWHIQCTIVVTLIAIALARVARHSSFDVVAKRCNLRWSQLYLLEYIVISVPVVISVNIVNPYIEYIIVFAGLSLAFIVWHSKCLQRASQREFEFGRRPALFTLLRSTINLLTALCILAIDFESFPKKFRKSRRYGAGLMDVGIGLFVFSMAVVSSRPRRVSDLRKSVFTVGCMLVLGLARTLVIRSIDYHQDEHEYGVHLNAFFTLGFTKLFGTLLQFLVKSDKYMWPLGMAILFIHEITLQAGLSAFVLDPELKRTDFLTANREGLCSLPGFIALYLLSQYFGQWIKSKDILNYQEIKEKLKHLSYASCILWLIVVGSIMLIGIARVTCNLGYVTWILAIAVTMCSLYLFVFDIILDTLYPVNSTDIDLNIMVQGESTPSEGYKIPTIIESINYNGLFYFLLANVLTGLVNIFLKTDERTNSESVLILLGYMLITTGVVSLLYRFNIRIA